MSLNIREILEAQGWKLERESSTAYFYNHAPWVAPFAYLHIVFKGAERGALNTIGDMLQIPESWRNVLSIQNGAILFSGAISFYGVHAPGTLLNRTDLFNRLPFSIEAENRSWPPPRREIQVVIGGYSYDGTRAVLDGSNGSVSAMPRKSSIIVASWPNTDTWIKSELTRMAALFDSEGRIQAEREMTLPYRVN